MAHLPTPKQERAIRAREGGTTGHARRVSPDGAAKEMTERNVAAQCGTFVMDTAGMRQG